MSSPVNATAKSPTANSYLTVAEADRIMRKRLYTTAWTNASTAADADGFLVNNGSGYSIGASSVVVDTGTGTFPANCVIKFAGHDTEYTVQSAQTGAGTLSISPALTAAVADDEAVQRETANEKEQALMWATQILDTMMTWYGSKRTREQALWYPATGVLDENGNHYDFDTVPELLKIGTVEQAMRCLTSDVFKQPSALGQGVSEVELGPLKAKIDDQQQQEVISGNILSLISTLGVLEPEAKKGSKVVALRRV